MLLTAARSVVAAVADQLARGRGMIVERLVRSDNGYRLLDAEDQTLGVGATVAEALAKVVSYNIILDPVGGPDTHVLIERTLPGGSLFSYGVLDDRPIEIKASTLLYKSLRWQGFGISGWLNRASPETLDTAMRECWTLLADHPSKLPVIARHKLADFRTALVAARKGAGEGKVLLV
jgi:NADPH:quinone reductase-like Zn-dependent oxidoreductase